MVAIRCMGLIGLDPTFVTFYQDISQIERLVRIKQSDGQMDMARSSPLLIVNQSTLIYPM